MPLETVTGRWKGIALVLVAGSLCSALAAEDLTAIDGVTLAIGDATAAPGQASVAVPVSLTVEPGVSPVAAWTAIVRYDPRVIGGVSMESSREAAFEAFNGQARFVVPGTVSLSVIYGTGGIGEPIGPATSGQVATLRFCVLESAGAGTYPLQMVSRAPRIDSPQVHATVTVAGRARAPAPRDGSLTVAGERVPASDCPPDVRPGEITATFRLGSVNARPGQQVTVPFFIHLLADRDRRGEGAGYQFSVDFDEEVLQVVSIDPVFELLEGGTEYGFAALRFDNSNQTAGNAGVDEGYLVGGVLFDFDSVDTETVIPEDRNNHMLDFRFDVNPATSVGNSTEIRFVDGAVAPGGSGRAPIYNIVATAGQSVFPVQESSYIFVDGLVNIVGDVSIFRGDSNADRSVDISDAQKTLSYLFLGASPPPCLDAADANDDGAIDVSDAIYLLGFLFLGTSPPPDPYPGCGPDLTGDRLGCRFSPLCK